MARQLALLIVWKTAAKKLAVKIVTAAADSAFMRNKMLLDMLPVMVLIQKGVSFTAPKPCISCAKLVVASGIKEFYYIDEYRLDEGKKFLAACKIKINKIKK